MDRKEIGIVTEALPSLKFRVQFPDGRIMIAYLAGRLHRNFIRVIIGDKVEVLIPPTGNIGRIINRK
jgi:translation initiation factor IF-1